MREFSDETVSQLVEQLNKVAGGVPSSQVGKAGQPSEVTIREAMIETAFLVAAVDGNVSDIEVMQFADTVESLFGADGDPKAILSAMAKRLETEGWDKRAKSVARALDGTGRGEQAYRLAVAVAFVDDVVEHAEVAALDVLSRSLEVPEDRAHEIMGEVRKELFG